MSQPTTLTAETTDTGRRVVMSIAAHERPPRILLADADDTTRAFLADNLAADGYDVIPVATEPAALAELAPGQTIIDMVLVDINGHTLAFVDRLRADDPSLGPPG